MAKKAPTPAREPAGDDEADLVSIGQLADASGISPDTIRAWERRYGRPVAVRLPSGHRRYTPDDVRWLRRVAEALAQGHRPSQVVHLDERKLDDLLAPPPESEAEERAVRRALDLLGATAYAELRRELARDAEALGPGRFVRERLSALLAAVGRGWADGRLGVRHEHALTEIVEDLLRSLRHALPRRAKGPLLVLATLPGEQHGLGLQMVALLAALASVRHHDLGPNVPPEEILEVVAETGAGAVGISVSLATGGVQTDRQLADLRRALPEEVHLLVGGAGARGIRRGPRGVEYVEDWDALERWLRAFAGEAPS